MDDWDAEEFEPPSVGGAAKQAPEVWSDEEGHDVKTADEPATVASSSGTDATAASDQLRPKQIAKAKLAEREAKEKELAIAAKARAAQAKVSIVFGDDRGITDGARGAQDSAKEANEGMAEKLRLRRLQEEADFENAQGIFDMSRTKKSADVPGVETIDAFIARNAVDGETLAEKVSLKLVQFENTPFFLELLKSIVKKTTTNLTADDMKDLSATVQVIANDRLKAEREKQKGKKKPTAASKKAAIKETHSSAFDNTDEYGDLGDDDFM